MRFPIHGYFACMACRLRSLDPSCPVCGAACLDLRSDEPEGWAGLAAHRGGLSLLSPRAALQQPSLLAAAAGLATLNALAPVVGPLVDGRGDSFAELALGAGLGMMWLPLLFAFYTGFLFALAHVARVISVVVAALPLPIFRLRQNLVAWLLARPARWWLPQLAAPQADPPAPDGRATLEAPWTVHFVRDALSYVERHDAWSEDRCSLRLPDGSLLTLDAVRGSLGYPPGAGAREDTAPEPPAWLRAPGRPGVRFTRVFPAGTAVTMRRNGDRVDLTLG